jgi:hypothetical protein
MLTKTAIRTALGLAFITLVLQLGARPQEKGPTSTQIDPPQPTDRFMGKWKLNLDKSLHTGMVRDRIKVEFQEGYVRFTRNSLNGNGFEDHYTFTTDMKGGSSKETQQNGRTIKGGSRVTRFDSSRFKEESPLAIDKYRVNPDGRSMENKRSIIAKGLPSGVPKRMLFFYDRED